MPDYSTHKEIDPFLRVVLRRRFEAIIREMVNALFKSGRSGVINTAMDFSCSLTDAKLQSISVAHGLPVHVGAIDLIPRAVIDKFGDDQRPGDCFANNSAYHGNTHCADFTLCAPVFFDGKIAFYTIARAHLGDMGFPTPTTYGPNSVDVYQEGLMLPCVRIQRDYCDDKDLLDICKANIRIPEQFYGDYLACLAAVRTGEKRLQELCAKYGREKLQAFIDEFQFYAEAMCAAEIAKLPKGKIIKAAKYDSEIDSYPDGIPLSASLTVDPDAGTLEFDLTENIDNLPLGINMSESTVLACCRMGALNVLGPDIPRCTGAFRRISVKMREGSAVGKPQHPAATSAATTNLCHLLAAHIQALFAEIADGYGTAYGSVGLPASCGVVSGINPRRNNQPFVNQIIVGYWGGPGLHGHDGWMTYGSASSQGILWQSSVEIVELQQPILIEELSVVPDSGGAGEWDGGPGARCVIAPRLAPITITINSAGRDWPPQGVLGGMPGSPTRNLKRLECGRVEAIPNSGTVRLNPGEALESNACGGGGYGRPYNRDPERVLKRVKQCWVSRERAIETYGVVLMGSGSDDTFAVDVASTTTLRRELRRRCEKGAEVT